MRYVIVYRDGKVGDPHSWQMTLFHVGLAQRCPWSFRAVVVLPFPDAA